MGTTTGEDAGLLAEKRKKNAKCVAIAAGVVILVVVLITFTGIIIWKALVCQLKDTESREGLGTPNFYMDCKGDNNTWCYQYFDYEYNNNSKTGGSCCSSKTNYLCEYPAATQFSAATAANKLKVLSFNVFERPMFLGREGQRERTCRIPRWIVNNVPEVDVIGFQEVFLDGCWGTLSSMRDMLKQHGFMHSTATVDDGNYIINGGTFIASRWPISVEKQKEYESTNKKTIFGYFIPKGINYAKITKTHGGTSKVYHIFDTHFENTGAENAQVREELAIEMKSFIDAQNIPASDPVIITGDYNIDYHTQTAHFNKVFNDTLKAELPTMTGSLQHTYDPVDNAFLDATTEDTTKWWLDYIMFLTDHQQPTSSTYEIMEAKSNTKMRMCWDPNSLNIGAYRFPDTLECHDTEEFDELSDHYPIVADFTF